MESNLPLVSCICPTAGRPRLLAQAVKYFERQAYPHKELVIVGNESFEEFVKGFPGGYLAALQYWQTDAGESTGRKRNYGIEQAKGDIILLWDDDDVYGSERIAYQVQPLLEGVADVTGLRMDTVFDTTRWQLWRAKKPEQFNGYTLGGTLCFWKRYFATPFTSSWSDGARYPDKSNGEDVAFMHKLTLQGCRLLSLPMSSHYIYVRHGQTSPFNPGTFFETHYRRCDPEMSSVLHDDLDFYRALRGESLRDGSFLSTPKPLEWDVPHKSDEEQRAALHRLNPGLTVQELYEDYPDVMGECDDNTGTNETRTCAQ